MPPDLSAYAHWMATIPGVDDYHDPVIAIVSRATDLCMITVHSADQAAAKPPSAVRSDEIAIALARLRFDVNAAKWTECIRGWAPRAHRVVYFAQSSIGGPIKIGRSADPARRLRELNCGNSNQLRVIGMMVGDSDQEYHVHRMFADARLRGEWFSPHRDLIDFINRRTWPELMLPATKETTT